jgi:hypothetical protein
LRHLPGPAGTLGLPAPAGRLSRMADLLAYGAALAVGLVLVGYVFPLDFLLGRIDEAHPPSGDLAQHIIGQRYFLADAWRWPLLQADNLAVPYGVNIAFVDAIPLLALLLKLLAPLLPLGFHGIGLWYGLVWLLQPLAAVWCLRSAGEKSLLPAVAIAVAAVSMPAWWNRFGHASLCGHWLLLLGLGLYLRLVARPGWRLWAGAAVLQAAALLVHPYLAVMVLALLGAAPLTLLLRRDRRWRAALLGFAATLAVMVGLMAMLDYLGVRGGADFGLYSMNLLSPIWPHASALFPVELPPVDATGMGGWEGYNYLGAGVLFGLLAAIVLVPRALRRMAWRHAGLALALLGLTLLALAPRPAIGNHVLLDLGPVPDWLQDFRSSGRFFWPVAYTLLVSVVLLAARRPQAWVAGFLLIAIGALQYVDAAKIRHGLHLRLRTPEEAWLIDTNALRAALAGQTSATLLPSWPCVPGDDPTPEHALLLQTLLVTSEVGLPASTMYVARWHRNGRCSNDRVLASSPLGRGELRVLTPRAQAAYLSLVPRASELCATLGSLVVCSDPAATAPPPTSRLPKLETGKFSFSERSFDPALLGNGWLKPDEDGVWSHGGQAELRVRRPKKLRHPLEIVFELAGSPAGAGAPQRVELRLADRTLASWELPRQGGPARVSTVLPAGPKGPLLLQLRTSSLGPSAYSGAAAPEIRLRALCVALLEAQGEPGPCTGQ